MKKNLFKTAFIAVVSLALFAGVFSSCKTNDPPGITADQTKLTASVDSCTMLLNAAMGNYPAASITTFQTVVTSAKTAAAVKTITQAQVDNLLIQLRAAKAAFLATAFTPIPANSVTFALKFDEGSGSTQLTTTGNKAWTAVLMGGPIVGHIDLPTFVAGHNASGKAMHFGLGSHLEISNFTPADLVKSQLSISVWVKTDTIYDSDYIISYNSYHTWKFQLQGAGKPFFTYASTLGILDADDHDGGAVTNAMWTHLVLSLDLTAGTETFYINGAKQWQWIRGTTNSDTDHTKIFLGGTLVPPDAATPLEIGLDYPIGTPLPTKFSDISYFKGAMDDLEFYNIALNDGQVAKLYNSEK